jgi:hypothetical protein
MESRLHAVLALTIRSKFGQDVEPVLSLSRALWGDAALWTSAVTDLPHGLVRREGPAQKGSKVLFGFQVPAKRTRLMYAAQAGSVARLRRLVAQGAQLELKDYAGRAALFFASQTGRVEAVRELLARGAAAGAADLDGITPLYVASLYGHVEVVRELLAQGAAANVNAASGSGYTPLHVASYGGHLEVVRELLIRGASPALKTKSGANALSIATQRGKTHIVELLVLIRAGLGEKY